MEQYTELLKDLLPKELGKIVLQMIDAAQIDYAAIAADASSRVLLKIKAVISDDSLSDFECVERIVSIFEDAGSDGGSRHNW